MATEPDDVTLRARTEFGIALDAARAAAIGRTTELLMTAARAALGRLRFEDEPSDFKTTLRERGGA